MTRPSSYACLAPAVSSLSSPAAGLARPGLAYAARRPAACRCGSWPARGPAAAAAAAAAAIRAPAPSSRAFHSTPRRRHDGLSAGRQTHYDTLAVPPDASVADIKKSFYNLSKLHHPDRNPSDPQASRRFVRISEAYAVLGHADKRAVYDRDVVRPLLHKKQQQQQQHRHPAASYHSTGPAGGRPASGLSRRRSAFRGPPPSFYRNAGGGEGFAYKPGAGGHKTASSGSSAGTANAHAHAHAHAHANPAYARSRPDTPHFDWDATERTHRSMDERTAQRRAAAAHGASFDTEPSMALGFFVMSAALVAGVLVPVVLFGGVWGSGDHNSAPARTARKTTPAASTTPIASSGT